MSLQIQSDTFNKNETKTLNNPPSISMNAIEFCGKDETSLSDNLDISLGKNEQNFRPSAVNVEGSSDVVIGTVTHIHGPVYQTVYHQNTNATQGIKDNEVNIRENQIGKLIKSESTSSSDISPAPTNSIFKSIKNIFTSKNSQRITLLIVLLLLIIVVIIGTLFIIYKKKPNNTNSDTSTSSRTSTDFQIVDVEGPGLTFTRKQWGGIEPVTQVPLAHPTSLVIISHTAGSLCNTLPACRNVVQSIQMQHINNGHPNVGYNFLIGGDANVYVGRGWDTRNFHSNDSIGISFLGNFVLDYPTPDMAKTTLDLLKKGVQLGKLSPNYLLVGHNQTYSTLSPGQHLYEVIKNWEHFSSKVIG